MTIFQFRFWFLFLRQAGGIFLFYLTAIWLARVEGAITMMTTTTKTTTTTTMMMMAVTVYRRERKGGIFLFYLTAIWLARVKGGTLMMTTTIKTTTMTTTTAMMAVIVDKRERGWWHLSLSRRHGWQTTTFWTHLHLGRIAKPYSKKPFLMIVGIVYRIMMMISITMAIVWLIWMKEKMTLSLIGERGK